MAPGAYSKYIKETIAELAGVFRTVDMCRLTFSNETKGNFFLLKFSWQFTHNFFLLGRLKIYGTFLLFTTLGKQQTKWCLEKSR